MVPRIWDQEGSRHQNASYQPASVHQGDGRKVWNGPGKAGIDAHGTGSTVLSGSMPVICQPSGQDAWSALYPSNWECTVAGSCFTARCSIHGGSNVAIYAKSGTCSLGRQYFSMPLTFLQECEDSAGMWGFCRNVRILQESARMGLESTGIHRNETGFCRNGIYWIK